MRVLVFNLGCWLAIAPFALPIWNALGGPDYHVEGAKRNWASTFRLAAIAVVLAATTWTQGASVVPSGAPLYVAFLVGAAGSALLCCVVLYWARGWGRAWLARQAQERRRRDGL